MTGAASGMGEAAARLLMDDGWPVLLCDLKTGPLNHDTKNAGGLAEVLTADISDPDFGQTLLAALSGRRIGALIHCAGLSPTMATPEHILEVNLAATIRLVNTVRPHMAAGGCAVLFSSSGAHILGSSLDEQINRVRTPEAVSSLHALATDSGSAYTISKRAVMLLVEREARAFGTSGARIVSLSPGIIDTPMGRKEMEQQPIMHKMVEMTPLPRTARPEEIAAVAVFLCSPAASFITGTDILVDGGKIAVLVGAARQDDLSGLGE